MEEAGADAHPSGVGAVGAVGGTRALEDGRETGLWCVGLAGAVPIRPGWLSVGAVGGTCALDDGLRTGLWCASLAAAMPVGRATE